MIPAVSLVSAVMGCQLYKGGYSLFLTLYISILWLIFSAPGSSSWSPSLKVFPPLCCFSLATTCLFSLYFCFYFLLFVQLFFLVLRNFLELILWFPPLYFLCSLSLDCLFFRYWILWSGLLSYVFCFFFSFLFSGTFDKILALLSEISWEFSSICLFCLLVLVFYITFYLKYLFLSYPLLFKSRTQK